jgi:hypothetical protein
MKDRTGQRGGVSARTRWTLVAATLLALSHGLPARAGRIHSNHLHGVRTEASLGPRWARFLAGGPALWSVVRSPKIPSGLVLAMQNGELVETPFVEYLLWRRSLNPARFDHYHPFVGPELGMLIPPPTTPVTPPGGTTSGGPPPVNPQPENGVPEPTGLFAFATLAAWAAVIWRRRPSEEASQPAQAPPSDGR